LKQIRVKVAVEQEHYLIHIGWDIIPHFADLLKKTPYGRRYAIITDSKVKPLYGDKLHAMLVAAGIEAYLFDFPEGELSKNNETKVSLDMKLLDRKLGRDSAIIALGGGVTGDVAGFVAATYLRGIPFIQIPTTIVAQADSSIGGKTAVDYPQGKNLIGAFHHPRAVLIDPATLATLDDRNYRSGLIEVVKHGLIRSRSFFEFLEQSLPVIMSRHHADYPAVMTELMLRNSAIKNAVVSADPKEKNLRKILNYGHTIGHAIEHLSGYEMNHGESVAVGIACEAFVSHSLGFLSESEMARQVDMIKGLGMPIRIPDSISTESIIDIMGSDKKALDKKVQIVLLAKIGKVKMAPRGKAAHPIETSLLRQTIDQFRNVT
jgi:3-dehydroquinate synthase